MRTLIRRTGVLAILILTSCGGGQSAAETTDRRQVDFQAKVREVIADEARADAVLQTVAEFHDVAVDAQAQAQSYTERFRALNANYEAPREDFEALIAADEEERLAIRERLLALRQDLVDNTTDEEWEALTDARHELVESAALAALEAAVPNHDEEGAR
jgi:hypothetical protein